MHTDVTSRSYRGEQDFWAVRDLLLSTYPITPIGFNWEVRRWDGWMFHREQPLPLSRLSELVHLWENSAGRVVGAVHPEGSGYGNLQLHPDYRHIESGMITKMVKKLSIPVEGGGRRLDPFVLDYDTPRRREVLVTRRLPLGSGSRPGPATVDGYSLRATRPEEADYRRVADIINAGFGRTSHTSAEVKAFMTGSPSFRHDLNLVAEAGDGLFAAYVGLTFDKPNLRGIVEPVCTHPEHRRRGLAGALIREGLRRLEDLGCTDVYVDTGDMPPANRLYESVGFTEAFTAHAWRKVSSAVGG